MRYSISPLCNERQNHKLKKRRASPSLRVKWPVCPATDRQTEKSATPSSRAKWHKPPMQHTSSRQKRFTSPHAKWHKPPLLQTGTQTVGAGGKASKGKYRPTANSTGVAGFFFSQHKQSHKQRKALHLVQNGISRNRQTDRKTEKSDSPSPRAKFCNRQTHKRNHKQRKATPSPRAKWHKPPMQHTNKTTEKSDLPHFMQKWHKPQQTDEQSTHLVQNGVSLLCSKTLLAAVHACQQHAALAHGECVAFL